MLKRNIFLFLVLALFAALLNTRCTIEQAPVTIVADTSTATVTAIPTVTIPAIPILSASGQNGSILLSWPAVDTATSYTVYDSLGAIVYTGPALSHTYPIANGISASFTVTASNSAGESIPSLQATSTAGVIDNLDGTVTAVLLNQRWDKCALGQYNPLTNGCDFPSNTYQYCPNDNYGICDNWTILTSGPLFYACAGIAKRVPIRAEVEAFAPIYNANPALFAGLDSGWIWTATAMNPTMCTPGGNCAGPGLSNRLRWLPVRCVRDGL